MKSMPKQGGFTLIELVVVITILGILAAFAVPRFASLEVEARTAATNALQGSVRSGAMLAHALWLAQSQPASVTMEGQTIDLVFGYPDLGTIDNTLVDITAPGSGFTYDDTTGVFTKTGATGTCTVTYAEAVAANTAPTILADTSGC